VGQPYRGGSKDGPAPYAASGSPAFSFTGQNEDTAAGLYDFLFREYHATQGRWISPDPAGMAAVSMASPQSWNRYGYVGNMPLSGVDEFGLLGPYGDCWQCNPYMQTPGERGAALDRLTGILNLGGSAWFQPRSSFMFDEELPVNLTPPPLIPNNIQQVLNFVLFRQPVDWGSVMGGSACNPICDAQKAPANNADPTLDNRANALAQAINKTGVQSLNNPCTVVGWYAASAIAGGGGVAVANTPEMAATVEAEYPSLVHRVLTWLNGLRPRGGTVSAAIAVVRAAPAQIKDTCSKLQ
jgi:RHS repeat-associated protein